MDETQKQLINEQMQKIPPEVRMVIENSDWERTVFNIGRAHKMHIDDIDALSIETILTMVGLEHPKDFSNNLQKHTGISNDTLAEIVDEINERLFTKIRQALQEYYEKVSAGEIMAPEEKDELHHAGIELDEPHTPSSPKRTPATLIDQKTIKIEQEATSSNEATPAKPVFADLSKISDTKSATEPTLSKSSFDPYREPIE
jgi:restriction endonuclease